MANQPFENVVQYLFQIAAQAEFKTLDDRDLLQRYVEHRNELAFAELVRRYKMMIWNVCWRVLRHHQDVEDAFQATLVTLVRRSKAVLGRETIEGWLHRVAYNVATKAKVSQARRHAREERRAKMQKESYESDHNRELADKLDRELLRIPEKYRSPLLLCYLDGLTHEQAAQKLKISIDTLNWRLREGRERLKKLLSRYGTKWGPAMLMDDLMYGMNNPEIPPGLVERSLNMVRILTLSNGVLETAGISPQVVTLAKGAMGVGTLKFKLFLGLVLLALAGAGAGAARYPSFFLNFMGWSQPQEKKEDPVKNKVDNPRVIPMPPRRDLYGDPLPPGALARLGTVGFRIDRTEAAEEVVFTPDSKAVGVVTIGAVPCLWNMKTGERLARFGDSLKGRSHADSFISLDGRRTAIRKDIAYHVYEVATGKQIRMFQIAGDGPKCCTLSPDGATLVACFNGSLRLMDIDTGLPVWEQKLRKKDIDILRWLVFAPDGKNVAVVYDRSKEPKTKEGSIELRDASTGKSLRTLGPPWIMDTNSGDLSFSPDSQTLLVNYAEGGDSESPSLYLWDIVTGKERWHLEQDRHSYRYPTFSPDGKTVVLHDVQEPNAKKTVVTWEIGFYDAATGKKLNSWQQQDEVGVQPDRLTFSPDGKVLATIQGFLIRCWNTGTGKVLGSPLFGHESSVLSVSFAPDGRAIVSRGFNQSVHIWDSFTSQKQRTLVDESCLRLTKSLSIMYSPAPAIVSADGKLIVGALHEVPPPDDKKRAPWSLAESAKICIFDATTGRELRQIPLEGSVCAPNLYKLALSPDAKFLAAWLGLEGNDFVCLWEVATGKPIGKRIEGTQPFFSPDNRVLMTYKDEEGGEKFIFWETKTGNKISAVTGMKFEIWPRLEITTDWQILIGSIVVSVDNKAPQKCWWYLNSLHLDNQAKIKLGRSRRLPSVESSPAHLAVSSDGRMIAWEHLDSVIHLMGTAAGEERARYTGHKGRVRSLSFSPDGRRLASSSDDTTVLVWDVTGGFLDERGQLCPAQLSDQQVQQLWRDLAGSDGVKANRAIWTLTAAPKQTMAFLSTHLSPVPPNTQASSQRIDKLVKELDSEKYAVRHKAEVELAKLGEAAEVGIRKSLEGNPSLETSHRLKRLLAAIEAERAKGPSADVLRSIRAIEILERIGTTEACKLLQTLSQGVANACQTQEAQVALQRLQQAKKHR